MADPSYTTDLSARRYEEYKAMPHFRALVRGYIDRGTSIFITASGHGTVGEAIDTALGECNLELETRGRDWGCDLFAVGDVDVRRMTRDEIRQVIELYESNTAVTNEDLGDSAI